MKITLSLLFASLVSTLATAQEYTVPKTEWGVPDFHGVWKHATIMPFERPVALGEKRAYTEAEALALEGAVQEKFDEANEPLSPDRAPPGVGEALPSLGNYDLFWREAALWKGTDLFFCA